MQSSNSGRHFHDGPHSRSAAERPGPVQRLAIGICTKGVRSIYPGAGGDDPRLSRGRRDRRLPSRARTGIDVLPGHRSGSAPAGGTQAAAVVRRPITLKSPAVRGAVFARQRVFPASGHRLIGCPRSRHHGDRSSQPRGLAMSYGVICQVCGVEAPSTRGIPSECRRTGHALSPADQRQDVQAMHSRELLEDDEHYACRRLAGTDLSGHCPLLHPQQPVSLSSGTSTAPGAGGRFSTEGG